MFCKNCGTENKAEANFCQKCGTSLKAQQKKTSLIIVSIVLVAVVCIVSFTAYTFSQKQAEYNGKLQTADRYLEKLDYEKAEDTYLEAIEIQPKKEDAYIKLADTYTAQGKFSEAVEILEQGKTASNGKKIQSKLKTVQANTQAELYESVLSQYRDFAQHNFYRGELGTEGFDSSVIGDDVNAELFSATSSDKPFHLYYALKDIDGNGTSELFIAGGEDTEDLEMYDVFVCSGEEAVHLFPDRNLGYRTHLKVYANGILAIDASGSAGDRTNDYYKMADDGYSLDLQESVSTYWDHEYSVTDQDAIIYYYGAEGDTEISKEEYESIKDKYAQQEEESFDWCLVEKSPQTD